MIYSNLYHYLHRFMGKSYEEIGMQLLKLKSSKIEAIISDLFRLLKFDYYASPSFFNFYAGSTFSGGDYPCSSIACRLKNVENLARFSALYADKVLIPSPIDKHFERINQNLKIDIHDLTVSIIILLYLEPLVKSGIVGFFSHFMCLCEECLHNIEKQENDVNLKLSLVHDYIESDFAETVKCELQRDSKKRAYFSVTGGEKFGLHNQVDFLIPNESDSIKTLLKESNNNPIVIKPELIKSLGLADYAIGKITKDLFDAQVILSPVESSYLTDRKYDIDLMEALEFRSACKDTLFNNTLDHQLPIVQAASLANIVKLRQNEGEAFKVYRDSINHVLMDHQKAGLQTLNEIQRDIIDPEIHKMEQTLKTEKKVLVGKAVRDVVLTGAGISIGCFSGLFPLDTMAVIGLLGGLPTISSIAGKIFDACTDSAIRENKYYFLWKLSKTHQLL